MKNILIEKWKHFNNFDLVRGYFKNDISFILLGQYKSGKTELIYDLLKLYKKEEIILNFTNIISLKEIYYIICKKINKIYDIKDKYKGLRNLIYKISKLKKHHLIDNKKLTILLIFENCQYQPNKIFIYTLFLKLNKLNDNIFNFQFIFLSRNQINLDLFKFYLNYPNKDVLREFLTFKLFKLTKNIKNYNYNEIENYKIISYISKHVEQVFNLIIKDFETFEYLNYLFFFFIYNKISKFNYFNLELFQKIFNSIDYKMFNQIIIENPNNSFKTISEMMNMIDNLKSVQKNNNIVEKLQIMKKEQLKILPIIPSIILISAFIGSKLSLKDDFKLFSKKRFKKSKKFTTYINKRNLKIKLSRLIALCEIVMSSVLNKNKKVISLEYNLSFHSNEFFVSLKFLDDLKLIKINNLENNKISIEFFSNIFFVLKCAKIINLDLNLFLNINELL